VTVTEPVTPPAPEVVPLARLQGVQRQLSQLQKDNDTVNSQVTDLTAKLTAAETRAAHEYAERMRTQSDLVPALIQGDTIEAVEQSITASKAAYAAAQAHYARTIPTPPPGSGNQPAQNVPDQRSPTQLISAGLHQANPNINT
jgi:multidrug resistance efflux pump